MPTTSFTTPRPRTPSRSGCEWPRTGSHDMKRPEKTTSRAVAFAATLMLTLAATSASSEENCATAETVGECLRQVRAAKIPVTAEAAIASVASEEKNDLEALPTGEDTGGTTLQSRTKDLLPLAAISGLLGKGDGGDDQGDIIAN